LKKRILVHILLVVVALALTATIVFAALELVGTDTRTNGVTTVTWDSRFADLDYTLGETSTMTMTWNIDAGAAEYKSFSLRCPNNNGSTSSGRGSERGCISFTPRSKRDPVNGQAQITKNDDNSVIVELEFTDLHLDPLRNVEMGYAHFKLYLNVDMDGDGDMDKVVSYGVNVLVEEPQ